MWIKPGVMDLTYCTNIHAGEAWDDVERSVQRYAPPIKTALSPTEPFGLGLRLSALAAQQLRSGDRIARFKQFLQREAMYVSVLNGFPYGSFHGETVKANVFAPDWRDSRRLQYTLDLADILSELLPAGGDGGISTLPLSYKPWLTPGSPSHWQPIVKSLTHLVARLEKIFRETGKTIHIDIEPEPNGLVENTEEFVAFFEGPLRSIGEPMLASELGILESEAREILYRHVQICFDVCHMAVAFESPVASMNLLMKHGIGIGRVQISSALRVPLADSAEACSRVLQELSAYVEPVYLHQVVAQQRDGTLKRYPDLDGALAAIDGEPAKELRVHFHVPVFLESFGNLQSTQTENVDVLRAVAAGNYTRHLEVETYTWSVLPEPLRMDLGSSIERELRWTLEHL